MRWHLQIILGACLSLGLPLTVVALEFLIMRRRNGPGWQSDPPQPPHPKPLPGCLLEAAQGNRQSRRHELV